MQWDEEVFFQIEFRNITQPENKYYWNVDIKMAYSVFLIK